MLPNHSSFARTEEVWGLACMQRWKRWRAITSRMNSGAGQYTIDCCCTFQTGSGRQLFLSWDFYGEPWHSAFFLIWQLLDSLISCGREKGSNIEACEEEHQSFVQDQPQLGCHASRKHSDISNVLSYLTHQSGFRSHRYLWHLYRVSSECPQVVFFAVISEYCYEFQVFQVTSLFQRGPVEEIPRFALNLYRVIISRRAIVSAICCVQSYVLNPLFPQRVCFTDNEISMLLSGLNVASSVCEDAVYDPWNRALPERYDAVVRDFEKGVCGCCGSPIGCSGHISKMVWCD